MTTKKTFVLSTAIAALLSAMAASTTNAAIITWGSPSNITGDSNVSTNGALVGAYNVGDTGVTNTGLINGVNFLAFALPTPTLLNPTPGTSVTVGNFNIQTTDTQFTSNNTLYGSGTPPFSLLSTNYKTLLRSGSEVPDPLTLELTMGGLILGAVYEFQWFANFSGPGTLPHSAVNPGGNYVDLVDNTTNVEGGVGQYAIGTFRASDTFESVTFLSGPNPQNLNGLLNGFQLRLTAIPEPTTALFGIALAGVCFGRRNRSSSKKGLTA